MGSIGARLPTHVRVWHRRVRQPVGSAFVLDEQHVMTCAHVVAESLDQKKELLDNPVAPDATIKLDMPMSPGRFFTARPVAEFWKPERARINPEDAAEIDDIAVLRLEVGQTFPAEARPVTIAAGIGDRDAAVVYGAEKDVRDCPVASGRFIEQTMLRRMKFQPDGPPGIRKGYSGAAAWATDRGGIAGMVVETRDDYSGLVIPVATLAEIWPAFDRATRGGEPARPLYRQSTLSLREKLGAQLSHFDRADQASEFETSLAQLWDAERRPLLTVIAGLPRDEPKLCRDKCRRRSIDRRLESLSIPSGKVVTHLLPWPGERKFDVASRLARLRNIVGDEIGARGSVVSMRAAYQAHGRPLIFFSEIKQEAFGADQRSLLQGWGEFWADLAAEPVSLPLVHFLLVRLDEKRFDARRSEAAYRAFSNFHVRVATSLGEQAHPLPILGHFDLDEVELWLEAISDEIGLRDGDISWLHGKARKALKPLPFMRLADLSDWIEGLRA